ncbi:caspase family protein [Amycolatopsis vancoresmycina]|uniref:Caspase-related protein n=1 Tax=Amycolatopsis vancoresmycina DSM 44592 TaxID=1292037 RepID=R1HRJ9_9PSEU|nr:caspase family protein [Amycolatopsis vancoresmycina]EOD66195.1 caspase-related protein [Amycolatopsis vancoresmycina DSM 44592]
MAGRRRALIVANGEYDNAGLQRLGSPAADADALAGVLADRAISDFDVRVVRNEAAYTVQAEIEDLCVEGKPDDVLLLHFSCHGLKDDTGALYFAARNTRPDRLRSTAVPAQFVQQCIRQSRSRSIVLLLDCCYGGAFGQGVAIRAAGDANVLDSFRGGRGRAVITASNSIEYAFEGATLASDEPAQPSVFTSALVEGLRTGEADRDEDGWIALGELYEYLFDRVRERNPKQTPSRDIEMQGELYLAKSRRRRIKPSPVPADLAAAIGAENPFTRLGAVAELRRRLASDNLPVAVGAFEALKAMVATDIEHVAAAAADAMSFAVVRVDAGSLSFAGDVVRRRIRLLGPPVARACRFEASHGWIEVRETGEGAEVTVTPGAGVRRGKVVVTGPTGETVVEVEAAAAPGQPEATAAAGTEVAPGEETEPEPTVGSVRDTPTVPESAAEPPAAGAPEPVTAPESGGAGPATAQAAPDPSPAEPQPSPHRVRSLDPAAAFGAVLAVAGGVFAVNGLPMAYRYGETLAYYRPGLDVYVVFTALFALLAGVLSLVPRTRQRTGPALLLGLGVAALSGLVRFVGDLILFSAGDSAAELGAGYFFELAGHTVWVVAGLCAVAALRRTAGLGRGPVSGRPARGAVVLGGVVAAGWVVQFGEVAGYDAEAAGRAAPLFVLCVLVAAAVPAVAVVLRPRSVGCVVLALGTAGQLGTLIPALVASLGGSSVTVAGQVIAVVALVLLAADTVVLVRRNQPNGRPL